MKYLYFIFFLLIVSSRLFAWNDNYSAGARSTGLSNASVTLSDIYAAQNNQAGLSGIKKISGAFYYENKFLIRDLSFKGAMLAIPVKIGVFGVSVNSFGGKNYNENKIGVSYSRSFGEILSAGVQMNYLGTFIGEGYGNSSAFAVEAGIQAKLIKNLFVGAHIFNPNRAKIAEYNNERAPTIIKLGLRYQFSDKVFLCTEAQKDISVNSVFKAGIEYQIIKDFYLRGGVSTGPVQNSFGFGYHAKYFRTDIAASYHQSLGYSTQIAFSFQFGKDRLNTLSVKSLDSDK